MTFFQRLVIGAGAFRKLVANPADPVNGPLFQQCVEYRLHEKFARLFRTKDDGSRLLDTRPRLNAGTFSIPTMSALPQGTLGYAFAHYFEEHAISPLEEAKVEHAGSDADYICARLREAHDVLHVVTGYDTDEIGEIELQAFNLGNLGFGPIPIIAIVGFFLSGISGKYGARSSIRRFREAYARGKQARFLADIVWEDHWSKPLSALRASYGLEHRVTRASARSSCSYSGSS